MAFEPCLHPRMRVRPVIVHDQVQDNFSRKFGVQSFEELQELLMAVPGIALPDHFSRRHFQRRKKRGRAIALVIVGHRAAPAFLHRQARLGAVQGLDLALLIHAKYQRLFRGIEIEAHYVGQLFQEPRIARKLEPLGSMRLQMMTLPNPVDRGFANALCLTHGPATPMRGAFGAGLQGGVDDGFNLLSVIHWLAPASLGHLPQTIGACFAEPLPPQGDGLVVDFQVCGDDLVLLALCGCEHNPAALRHLLRRTMGGDPASQFSLVGWTQCDWHGWARHALKIAPLLYNTSYL